MFNEVFIIFSVAMLPIGIFLRIWEWSVSAFLLTVGFFFVGAFCPNLNTTQSIVLLGIELFAVLRSAMKLERDFWIPP